MNVILFSEYASLLSHRPYSFNVDSMLGIMADTTLIMADTTLIMANTTLIMADTTTTRLPAPDQFALSLTHLRPDMLLRAYRIQSTSVQCTV